MDSQDSNEWYGPESATFGDRVAAARENAGMTQRQLAKRLGVKLKTLQDWENDISEPRANKLSMMAGLLNVYMSWLITGEGEGLGEPGGPESIEPEINDLLIEMRELKLQIVQSGERLGRLEKQLRLKLQGGA